MAAQVVRPALEAAGHRVHTPTMTGLGERVHLLSSGITMETFVADVANLMAAEDAAMDCRRPRPAADHGCSCIRANVEEFAATLNGTLGASFGAGRTHRWDARMQALGQAMVCGRIISR